jgi:hypothetical protein
MDGRMTTDCQPVEAQGLGRDLALLGLLLLLATGIRTWVVGTTEVPARDSIGFIRYALQIQEQGWAWALRHQHQHPGYPLTLLAVAGQVGQFDPDGDACDVLQFSAQLASSLAGVLLVIPMFCLGRLLLDRGAGFWGALLFQCLPASGHALSDAISDPLFLLLLSSALVFALLAVRRRSAALFAGAGAWCGLAYLTRPEGALVLPATGLAVLGAQAVSAWRQPWRRVLGWGAAMVVPALVVGSPYYLTTGNFTNKPAMSQILGTFEEKSGAGHTETESPEAGPLLASLWAVHLHEDGPMPRRLAVSALALGSVFAQCYQYVGWLPVLIGIWWYGGRCRRMPEAWVLIALIVLDALVLWGLSAKVGYLSDRHVMVLVVCTIFQAVAVVREAPYRLRTWLARRWPEGAAGRPPLWQSAPLWSLARLLLWTGVGLSRTLKPLHGNRAGHRAAGLWLKDHTDPADIIDDDHCWAHFYAGRVFLEGKDVAQPLGGPKHFLVFNRSKENKLPSHLPTKSEDQLRQGGAQVVYHWPEVVPEARAQVVIYRLPAH